MKYTYFLAGEKFLCHLESRLSATGRHIIQSRLESWSNCLDNKYLWQVQRCPYSTLVDYVGDFINTLVPSIKKQLIQSFWDLSKDPFKALSVFWRTAKVKNHLSGYVFLQLHMIQPLEMASSGLRNKFLPDDFFKYCFKNVTFRVPSFWKIFLYLFIVWMCANICGWTCHVARIEDTGRSQFSLWDSEI